MDESSKKIEENRKNKEELTKKIEERKIYKDDR